MRLNILSVLLQICISFSAIAQFSKADWKIAKSLPLAEKLYAIFLVPDDHSLATNSNIYGFLDAGRQSVIITNNKPRIINIAKFEDYEGISFPSKAARNKSAIPIPNWMPSLFNAKWMAEISDTTRVAFYGVDTTGIWVTAKPYLKIDSLSTAYLSHDLIYYSGSSEIINDYCSSIKLKSKVKKQINEKYLRSSRITNRSEAPNDFSGSYEAFNNWAISVYATNSDLSIVYKRIRNSSNAVLYIPSSAYPTTFIKTLELYHSLTVVRSPNLTRTDSTLLRKADLIIIPINKWCDNLGELLNNLPSNTIPLIIRFGSETKEIELSTFQNHIHIPDDNALSEAVTAQRLNGAYNDTGHAQKILLGMPNAAYPFDTTKLTRIDSLINIAITEKAMPGCQILIAKDNRVIWNKSYGYYTYDSLQPVNDNTLYDLASLTKPLATTLSIIQLVEEGKVNLDTPLSNYLPYLLNTNKDSITTRQVLAHQAGLYPYFPFWKKAIADLKVKKMHGTVPVGTTLYVESFVADSITLWAAKSDLLAERIDTVTHEQYMYSDVGFYFLQDLIEKTTNQSLDQYVYSKYYKDLGTGLRFTPLKHYPIENIAPTEHDRFLRNELVQGFVHDRNAALKGGVAGHSGLFGNARDVAIMMQLQLNQGVYGGVRYYSKELAREFTTRHFANNRRGLGWDMPGPEPDGPVSKLASEESFGHTGFTGVTIWADPKENLIFVFLSNRVYPSAENNKLIENNIRTRIQDIIYESLNEK